MMLDLIRKKAIKHLSLGYSLLCPVKYWDFGQIFLFLWWKAVFSFLSWKHS